MALRPATVVVPCYNEAARLQPALVRTLVDDGRLAVILVDDGSSDGTLELAREIERASAGCVTALALEQNEGKAEAVRRGMLAAIGAGAEVVGFADADFATPPEEIVRLLDELERTGAAVVLGSRIQRLGADIDRRPVRRLLGRVFAAGASVALSLPVRDTQCGAKLFAVGPALRRAVARPFRSRWIFDVELLGRLMAPDPSGGRPLGASDIVEVPLDLWHDVGGSKLGSRAMARAGVELARLIVETHRRGRGAFMPEEGS